ncbi:MAG: DegT/DnrJ/EryC1/StrS family aminotransferase, partial [Candidatus Omnitrophota bacterium]
KVPQISPDTQPAFNRLPLVFEDLEKKEKTAQDLLKAGIETSQMYYKPLHQLLDLGYKPEDFPNAVYFAGHLLTVPCHPLLSENDIQKIIELISQP